MRDWIISEAYYILSNWQMLLLGGAVVVGVVIFLMGILKKALINKVKNNILRRIILAWLSVILVLPITAVYTYKSGISLEHFWVVYVLNCVSTIVVYWLYENTAIRDGLSAIGKKVVMSLFKSQNDDYVKDVMEEAKKETQALFQEQGTKTQSKFKEDDLDNL